jgi:hypothetical protein
MDEGLSEIALSEGRVFLLSGTFHWFRVIMVGSYVDDGALMGDKSLISNEEQIFKRCTHF